MTAGERGGDRKGKGGGAFPMTPWTLVQDAAPAEAGRPLPEGGGRRSLGELTELYRQPLTLYLRRRHGLADADADDVLGAFVADRVVAGRLLSGADRQRGRFRTLLLVALDRQVIDWRRANGRHARHGRHTRADVDVAAVADGAGESAEAALTRAWARQVLGGVIADTSRHCQQAGRGDVWLVLEQRVILPALDGLPPVGNAEIAARLGEGVTAAGVSNLLVTGKRLLARKLREAVAAYAPEAEVDDEVKELWAAFAGR